LRRCFERRTTELMPLVRRKRRQLVVVAEYLEEMELSLVVETEELLHFQTRLRPFEEAWVIVVGAGRAVNCRGRVV
jgi:hypothetical protein